jgi:hypothetical protein
MKGKFRLPVQVDYEWLPHGSIAPQGAWYVEFDYNGKPTGIWVSVGKGTRLPNISPQGHTWQIARRSDEVACGRGAQSSDAFTTSAF